MLRAPSMIGLACVVAACSSASETNDVTSSSGSPSSGGPPGAAPTSTAPPSATATNDAGAPDADGGQAGTYRTSLSVCWTDATCKRAMIVAHGGDWSATGAPYGSLGAVTNAYKNGVDAVKIDVRVTKDKIPVVSHSSPLGAYESLDCYGKKIEDMTAAEVTKCHFVPSQTETFQRLDAMLGYARGKLVVQLTVKESVDYARTIAEVVALGAQDFAFIEVTTNELETVIPGIPGADQVRYLVNVESNLADVDKLLGTMKNPRVFMVEMNPSPQVASVVSSKLHPAGIRSFTYDSGGAASEAQLHAHFDEGFDVVSANATANNLKARVAVNKARGVTPP